MSNGMCTPSAPMEMAPEMPPPSAPPLPARGLPQGGLPPEQHRRWLQERWGTPADREGHPVQHVGVADVNMDDAALIGELRIVDNGRSQRALQRERRRDRETRERQRRMMLAQREDILAGRPVYIYPGMPFWGDVMMAAGRYTQLLMQVPTAVGVVRLPPMPTAAIQQEGWSETVVVNAAVLGHLWELPPLPLPLPPPLPPPPRLQRPPPPPVLLPPLQQAPAPQWGDDTWHLPPAQLWDRARLPPHWGYNTWHLSPDHDPTTLATAVFGMPAAQDSNEPEEMDPETGHCPGWLIWFSPSS